MPTSLRTTAPAPFKLPPIAPPTAAELERREAPARWQAALPPAPCAGQTAETIEAWLRANVRVGAELIARDTQGGVLAYLRLRVTGLGQGRFYVEPAGRFAPYAGGASYYYSGKNTYEPKGQTRLVIPTPEVLAAADICETQRFLGDRYRYRDEARL